MNPREADLRPIKIATLGMASGIVTFGAVVVLLVTGGMVQKKPESMKILLPIAAAATVGAAMGYVVVRQARVSQLRRLREAGEPADRVTTGCVATYRALTLIGSAMAEGIGLFGLISVLLTGVLAGLVLPALAVLVILAQLPSHDRLQAFVSQITEGR